MLKVGEQKSIFDIAKVIGNIRTDLIITTVEKTTVEEVEETKPEEEKEKKSKKTDTL